MSNHHRNPKSRGGGDGNGNISVITTAEHRAWHVLASNDMPHTIARTFNRVFKGYGTRNQNKAWRTLFNNLTLDEICDKVNRRYLDLRYNLRYKKRFYTVMRCNNANKKA